MMRKIENVSGTFAMALLEKLGFFSYPMVRDICDTYSGFIKTINLSFRFYVNKSVATYERETTWKNWHPSLSRSIVEGCFT
jgi:hypothetical protein